MTIDSLSLASSNDGKIVAHLNRCVGNVTLSKVDDFYVIFYNELHKITLHGTATVSTSKDDYVIKSHVVLFDNVDIEPNDVMPEYEVFDNLNEANEDAAAEFALSRRKLLNDSVTDNREDENFADLF
jgi:hypothetical protein